ncbi:HAD-IIA family hydrolase [Neobacillus sp. SM06]|uniref:HAD-IIA family hydrolase n=1 Tax=Neobacillus sp. SM06 TaxID=3422492 RepID=UPI003D2A4B5B
MVNIHDFDAFCFDLDGTIYVGDQLLPGVKETIDHLREANKKILFITNSPTLTRADCQKRLIRMGIAADLEEVLTATFLSALYFQENHPQASIFVVGEKALEEELSHIGLHATKDPMKATHVLVGMDRDFTYEKLNLAMNAVRNGASLVLTNPDPACPVPGGYISDTMAIARAIEAASGRPIDHVVGKPSPFYAKKVLERLQLPADRCLIIGDRLETDIMLGKADNFRTCLVLTGSSCKEDVGRVKIFPDYIVENLEIFFSKRRRRRSISI